MYHQQWGAPTTRHWQKQGNENSVWDANKPTTSIDTNNKRSACKFEKPATAETQCRNGKDDSNIRNAGKTGHDSNSRGAVNSGDFRNLGDASKSKKASSNASK